MLHRTSGSDTLLRTPVESSEVALVADMRAARGVASDVMPGLLGGMRGGWRGRVFLGLVPDDPERQASERAHELAESVRESMPAVTIGLSEPARREVVPSALWEARRAAIYGMRTPAPGPHLVRDFPVEEALARKRALLRRIASTVRVLTADPELALDLTVFYAHDGDRSAAAAALYVHTRTLDHRLRRIARETGLRPRSFHDSRVLQTSLMAHELLTAEREMSALLPVSCDADG